MRAICEGYFGVTPAMIGDLTFDQLYVMIAPKERLSATLKITPSAARSAGLVRGRIPEGGSRAAELRLQAQRAREREKKRGRK